MEKRLYLSRTNKVIGGVCGGLGEYFGLDPVLIRIIAVILALGHGFGVLAYIVCWIAMPKWPAGMPVEEPEYQPAPWHKHFAGLLLIVIGLVLLIRENWYWFYFDEIWPVLLILAGLAVILMHWRRNGENHTYQSPEERAANGTPYNGPGNGGSL